MKLFYSLLVTFFVFYLITIFWPLIFLFILMVVGYIIYVSYKAKAYQKAAYDSSARTQDTFTNAANPVDDSTIEKPIQHGSVIDVEFTESSRDDD